ncbi:MAG: hypothetical protein V3U27_08095 [Candidatus Tectomicrobia bacterium]
MDFVEVIQQARALLQSEGRITYRTLQRQFALDDEALEDLKEELLFSAPQIADVDGRGLVWSSDSETPANTIESPTQPPASYTPPHLAERIRAEQQAMESRGAANGERKTITAIALPLNASEYQISGVKLALPPTADRKNDREWLMHPTKSRTFSTPYVNLTVPTQGHKAPNEPRTVGSIREGGPVWNASWPLS